MSRHFDLDFSDLTRVLKDIRVDLGADAKTAMTVAASIAKRELREQTTRAGLGTKIANTWQDKVYPLRRDSLEPAGYIYSRAPDIVAAYTTGATIRPVNGGRYLWIPTKSVPRARGKRGSTKRMIPDEVEAHFNADFVFRRGKSGNLLAFIPQGRGTTKKGAMRKVRKGRLAHGAAQQLVLMFTLVRTVQRTKALDLEGVANRGAENFATLMGRESR